MQGLNSTDPTVKEETIVETEKRLHDQEASKEEENKTVVNRTVINTQASVRVFFSFEVKAVCSFILLNSANSHSLSRRRKVEQYLQVCSEHDFIFFTGYLIGRYLMSYCLCLKTANNTEYFCWIYPSCMQALRCYNL